MKSCKAMTASAGLHCSVLSSNDNLHVSEMRRRLARLLYRQRNMRIRLKIYTKYRRICLNIERTKYIFRPEQQKVVKQWS